MWGALCSSQYLYMYAGKHVYICNIFVYASRAMMEQAARNRTQPVTGGSLNLVVWLRCFGQCSATCHDMLTVRRMKPTLRL